MTRIVFLSVPVSQHRPSSLPFVAPGVRPRGGECGTAPPDPLTYNYLHRQPPIQPPPHATAVTNRLAVTASGKTIALYRHR